MWRCLSRLSWLYLNWTINPDFIPRPGNPADNPSLPELFDPFVCSHGCGFLHAGSFVGLGIATPAKGFIRIGFPKKNQVFISYRAM